MKREVLIKARKRMGWTKPETAFKLHITLSHYEKIECGARNPGYHVAVMINNLFGETIFNVSKPHEEFGETDGQPSPHTGTEGR